MAGTSLAVPVFNGCCGGGVEEPEDVYTIFGFGSGSGPTLNGTVGTFDVSAGVICGVVGFEEVSAGVGVSGNAELGAGAGLEVSAGGGAEVVADVEVAAGVDAGGGSPQEFSRAIDQEISRYSKIIQSSQLKGD